MVLWVQVLATKLDDSSLIHGTHMWERDGGGEN